MVIDRKHLRHCSKDLSANLIESESIEDILKAFYDRKQKRNRYHPIKPKIEPLIYKKVLNEI